MISFEVTYKLVQEADLSNVGGRLKQARLDKGLTIKDLAKLIKVSEVTLGRWEKDLGEIENHPDKIKNICKELDVSPKYIFAELDSYSFAAKLKRSRFEMGLSRRELASLLGVNRGTIKEWEEGSQPRKYSEFQIMELINKIKAGRDQCR
ncbi:MAG: transcriptional repressor DicA [Firmicutes bacterium ADurb.Bin373]|nr:XRE family transcriptional regulator [Bacillota bacterium]OQA10580.1 MAG: transcriptional repressor DicA [Firmicutes bacterium ADurb.Bin373]